ncbi:MAG: hypothetical protein AB7F86_15405, partial [Bdellovibrionales bacterium]
MGLVRTSLFLTLLATTWVARAADSGGANFGALYGVSIPDVENTSPYMLMGFKGSAFLAPFFSTGGYYLASDKQGQPSATDKYTYILAGVEGMYHIPSGAGDTYFGLRIGISKVKTNPSSVDTTFSPYHYGIATGYDYTLWNLIVIGFEGSYIHLQTGKSHQSGVTVY